MTRILRIAASPIKLNPTLNTLIPPSLPKSFAYAVGARTKCPPSRLKLVQMQNAKSILFI